MSWYRNLKNCNHADGKKFTHDAIRTRPNAAKIDPGKTPEPSHSGRIAPLTSPLPERRGERRRLSTSIRETAMNWDQIQVNWMIYKGKVRNNWVKLTDEDLTRIGGRRDELIGRLQARYGFAKAEAEREIEAWMRSQRHAA